MHLLKNGAKSCNQILVQFGMSIERKQKIVPLEPG